MNAHDHLVLNRKSRTALPTYDRTDRVSEPLAWPTLSRMALHGFAGEIVCAVADTSEADPAAILATVLGLFGIAAGRAPRVRVGDDWHHARLFSVVVGASARARKGTSEKGPKRIYAAAEKLLTSASSSAIFPCNLPLSWVPGPLSSGEGLIYAIRDGNPDQEDGDPGVKDKRLFVVEGEFASPLRAMQRQGNTLSTGIRSAWDGCTIAPLTKSAPIKASDPHVGIVGHITQQELRTSLANVEIYNGFANRFLWWCARRSQSRPLAPGMSESLVEDLGSELSKRIAIASRFSDVEFSDDARALYAGIYEQLTADGDDDLWAVVTSRAEAQVIRLALAYALLEASPIILVPHLEAAIAAWQYCNDSARFLFSSVTTDLVTERISDALKLGSKTTSELYRDLGGHINRQRMKQALESLQSRGRIDRTEHKTSGRSCAVWTLRSGTNEAKKAN